MSSIISLVQAAIIFGTVIAFGALGEVLTEKSGNLNLGVPGVMYLGGIAGLTGVFFYESAVEEPIGIVCVLIALVCGFCAAALGGLIYSFLTITLRANQNVTGLALTIFGSGVANFFGGSLNKLAGGVGQISVSATSGAFRATIPFLSDLGGFAKGAGAPAWLIEVLDVISKTLFSYGFLVYAAIALAIFMQIFINKTRCGLKLRAVGESPATADATGVNVIRYKYLSTCIGTGISGIGGLFYVMDYTKGTWANDCKIEALGWLAVALVIFATWKPRSVIFGAYLFGILYWMYFYISGLTRSTQELFKMLPYIVTIVVLIITSLRRKKENQPPEALGLPYFREER